MNQSSVTICTKLPSIIKKYGNKVKKNKIYDLVTNNIELSLKSLNKNVIDYYLIHDEYDFITYGDILIDALTLFLLSLKGCPVTPPSLLISILTKLTAEFLSMSLLTDKTPGTIQ